MHDDPPATTFLFTDIEGSTRLWEEVPERMRPALARHDAIARAAVEEHRGQVVKMTGDGLHAAFDDPLDALGATLQLQLDLLKDASLAIPLQVRCGLHAGPSESRDSDYYGTVVNRAARIMSAAHGGQMLLSRTVAQRIRDKLPDGVSLLDLGRVRLRDLARAEHLYQVVHPDLRRQFPALRSLEATPNNLPQQVTSFVGRAREQAAALALLAKHRLVTIAGMGGMGKSRLALQVAAEIVQELPDGVWLVELAALRDPFRVAQALASVLGVAEDGRSSLQEALARHVKDRTMLIVLDNCEHLLTACAELARALLAAGGGLRILATSREPLQIPGEAVLGLSTLPVPGPRVAGDLEAVRGYDSVRLFIERASAAHAQFRLDADNAVAIAAICHRLEGIPLAIELAAARVRTLPVQQIASRLNDRLRLLASGDPTSSPRQRTLDALIDWSHDLLSEEERRIFAQLAVFAGGWTVEAAERVCMPRSAAGLTVLEVLGHLVEKSLVAMDDEGQRYRMLETVREYAQERLQSSGQAADTARRHFDFYLELADRARMEMVGPRQAQWLAVLDAELENILAAHRWVDRVPERARDGLRLVSHMKVYWITRGVLELGGGVTLEALARQGAQDRDDPRSRALFDAGQIAYFMERHQAARTLLEESLAIARELGDDRKAAAVLQPLGMTALALGDPAGARRCLTEALAIAEANADKRGVATAANVLGQLHRMEAAHAEAAALYEKTVAISRELGDPAMIAVGLLNLAMVRIHRGELDRSFAAASEALEISERLGSLPLLKSAIEVTCGLAASRGDFPVAARLYGAAEAYGASTGLGRDPADAAFLAPLVRKSAEVLGDRFAELEAAGRALPAQEALRETRAWLDGVSRDIVTV
ncbi:MAG TPA: tetratricopeptide repeat protein [Usitatibacter sp.]|nr:tetratricopeptide repeat protein [Usitatibacter sp.]